MERAFIVTSESEFYKKYQQYFIDGEFQNQIVNLFMKQKGIESDSYIVKGDGMSGVPFYAYHNNIHFGIIPTQKDNELFGKYLKNPDSYNVCYFKSNSKIAKEFAQTCIENKVVVNLDKPRARDYFKSLKWEGYISNLFRYNNNYYLNINSKALDSKETPEGFIEIKLSESYKILEDLREQEENR